MSHLELGSRRRRLIPSRTSLDLVRELGKLRNGAVQIGGGSLPGGARRVSHERPTAEEPDWRKIVAGHVFQKPTRREERARPKPLDGKDEQIDWKAEVSDKYNTKGDLGIIIWKFIGIKLTEWPFLKGRRNYGPDVTLFYSVVSRAERRFLLLLSTCGDIFEVQVVPRVKDVGILFQDEIHLPQLTTTHAPTSMTVSQKNGLVVVGYNLRTQ